MGWGRFATALTILAPAQNGPGGRQKPPAASLLINLNMTAAPAGQDWRAWFAEYGARLRLIARQWTSGKAHADDVLPEAFVRFWKH